MIGLQVTYFSITTLTTIGLGDFHPKSNFERIINTIVMVSGVAMFSFIFSQVDKALTKIRTIFNPFDDAERQLFAFFGVLKRLNGNTPIQEKYRLEIEAYFELAWAKDRTQAVKTQHDQEIFEQLPHSVRYRIYHDYLFDDLLSLFRNNFCINRPLTKLQKKQFMNRAKLLAYKTSYIYSYKQIYKSILNLQQYNWNDPAYSDFMILLLNSLEPRVISPGTVILNDGQPVIEQFYIMKGYVQVMAEIKE